MELKTLSDIRPLERHRVEDVDKYSDAELGALLKGIFGLADIPGTIKKLKAKELYLLADGVAKKPLANLPVQAPVAAAAAAGGKSGSATGAVAAPKADGNAGLTDKEIIDLNRRLDEAEKTGPERFGEAEAEEEPYAGKLRGEAVPLAGMEVKEVDYKKRPEADRQKLRNEFDSTERKKFLQDTANDPQKVRQMKAAGLDDNDIALMKKGGVPDPYQVHHKLPIDDGGTNSRDNLILVKHEPYHKALTNKQNELTKGMKPGESKTIEWPVPSGIIYPA